jgi:CRP/FNR family transcriptional regulator, dissimilatory nitrate respiration regulator
MRETEPRNSFDLGGIPLFEGLEPVLLEGVARTSSCRSAAKGERIYWQGDTPRAFYCVLSGHVRRAIASAEGEEKVIDILSPGQYFGLAELFGTSPYVSFAEAVEPTILLHVGKEGLLGAIEEDPLLALRLLGAVAERQASFERDVAACFFQSGCRRLVDYLLREAGPSLRSIGDTIVELPISKRLIAARIGVTAETLSRAFRELSDAGLISVRGRSITLRETLASRRAAKGDDGETPVVHEQWNRRRSDLWVGRTAFSKAVASRALM